MQQQKRTGSDTGFDIDEVGFTEKLASDPFVIDPADQSIPGHLRKFIDIFTVESYGAQGCHIVFIWSWCRC